MKPRERKLYGVLTIENGNAFVDRYTEAERDAIKRTGLEHGISNSRRIRYFEKRNEAFAFAEEHLTSQIKFFQGALKRLQEKG